MTVDEVTIRRATIDDVDAVLDLRAAVASEGVWIGAEVPLDLEGDRAKHLESIEKMEAGERRLFLVAVRGDEIIGTLFVGEGPEGIGDLGMNLAADARGHGLGQRLMDEAVSWARDVGLHKLALQHWPWNRRARRLYERVGFVEEGYLRRHYRRKDGSVWDAVIMGLVLDHDRPGHDERASEPPRRPPAGSS